MTQGNFRKAQNSSLTKIFKNDFQDHYKHELIIFSSARHIKYSA